MVLVTGASGFVGQHLVAALAAQGLSVRALYHSHKPVATHLLQANIEWVCCDLLDIYAVEEAFVGIKQVYHCAAIISFEPDEEAQMMHFNVESTAHVVDEAVRCGVEKLIYISSIAALGQPEQEDKTITEAVQWGENSYGSAYGMSKYLAETEVWRGIGEGLTANILNPGIILGEGDFTKGSAALIQLADRSFPFYTQGITAWVDVHDVVSVAMHLMSSEVEGENYILSGGNHSYRSVLAQMSTALGKQPAKWAASRTLTQIIWRLLVVQRWLGKRPIINKQTAKNAQSISYYDSSKLLAAIPGFSYTPLEETIERMVRAYKKK